MKPDLSEISLFYLEFGAGIPFICLHGAGADHTLTRYVMEPIFEGRDGWRRIYPDLPGHGETKGSDLITTQDQVLDAVIEFIDSILPGGHFVLGGESYGGYVSLGILSRMADRIDGLLLVVPAVTRPSNPSMLPSKRAILESPDLMKELDPNTKEFLQAMLVVQNRDVIEAITTVLLPVLRGQLPTVDEEEGRENPSFSSDVSHLNKPFDKPALFLTGRQDHICGYKASMDLIDDFPRASYAVLDRAGHGLEVEQQTVMRCLVNEWIDRVEESIAS